MCSGDRSRNNTYLSQPVTENESNTLQYSTPLVLFYVKGFTSDLYVVTAQARAIRQRVDLVLAMIEEPPTLMYFLSRRPFTVAGAFVSDYTLKVMTRGALPPDVVDKIMDGMGFQLGGTLSFVECAGYRLWLTTTPTTIHEMVPTFITENKHHLTQVLLSSLHNAESAIEILRQEPRTTTDRITDVFVYRFANVKYLMIKWSAAGYAIDAKTVRAISGIENSIVSKSGLPAFTQLTQRNAKIREHLELETRKRGVQTPLLTPRREEERSTPSSVGSNNSDRLLEARLGSVEQALRQPDNSIQQIIRNQNEMVSRIEELTEVSNLMVTEGKDALTKRVEQTEQKVDKITTELAITNQMLRSMLQKLGDTAPAPAVTISAFKSQVVKPGHTTPVAEGGPAGASRRV
jgi:hypothetical protein